MGRKRPNISAGHRVTYQGKGKPEFFGARGIVLAVADEFATVKLLLANGQRHVVRVPVPALVKQ